MRPEDAHLATCTTAVTTKMKTTASTAIASPFHGMRTTGGGGGGSVGSTSFRMSSSFSGGEAFEGSGPVVGAELLVRDATSIVIGEREGA